MKQRMKHGLFTALAMMLSVSLWAGAGRERGAPLGREIAVFIPGLMAGSAIYEMLAQGVKRAAQEAGAVNVTVIEGGYNQADWEASLTSLAAMHKYDLIVSSNPSLPALVQAVSARFPQQKFLLLDGEYAGNPSVYTLRYNQREQAYLAGYCAALNAQERGTRRIGLVAGQEYPAMNDIILPAYTDGARAVDPDFTVDFRVLGNWFDAGKAADLSTALIRSGVGVILAIAGGGNEGVVAAAAEHGAGVVWFDTNGYALRPGVIVGSAVLYQEKAAYEKTKLFLAGELPLGKAEVVGIAEGYVDFIEDDPHYQAAVSESVRQKQAALIARLRAGALKL
ncbi:MAG: BMP family ABC transporter substrate-binding protein [Spirochaetaceae bacterium]|jgi:simple sugar transport system substrate-binding protein|nr:BMP family ABC transporter substrate-binding protein [Spirochaetaceae bacterium]